MQIVTLLLIPGAIIILFSRTEGRRGKFDGERAFGLVREQVAFGPRIPGTPAHRATGDWIISQLAQAGWRTEEQVFEAEGQNLRNIIATPGESRTAGSSRLLWAKHLRDLIVGVDPGAPVLLGTHYDTRPLADRDPARPTEPVPGANDGASGVAVLLELAQVLDLTRDDPPVWLVFFDGEDGGGIAGRDWILGSRHFAEHLTVRPRAVVVVDMVGDADLQLYFEATSDFDLGSSIWDTANQLGYRAFIPVPKHAIIDDHTPFLDLGIPSVLIIDFDYPYWHTTQDTLDKISADSLEQVGATLEVWLEESEP